MINSSTVTQEEQEVADAIKALRAELGESQQRFSDRLGVVVRTIARYELEKPPSGEMLGTLRTIAQEAGRPDLGAIFSNAFWREINEELGRKLDIEVPHVHVHYAALLWFAFNGGARSQRRVETFLREEIARIAKERTRDLDRDERKTLGFLVEKEQ